MTVCSQGLLHDLGEPHRLVNSRDSEREILHHAAHSSVSVSCKVDEDTGLWDMVRRSRQLIVVLPAAARGRAR